MNDLEIITSGEPCGTTPTAPPSLPVVIGADASSGTPIVLDLLRCNGILCAGASGSGKTSWALGMIAALLKNPPNRCRLLVIDPKQGVDFGVLGGSPHLLAPPVDEISLVPAAIQSLLAEIGRRYQVFRQAGAPNFTEYRRTGGDLPAIVVAIDEVPLLLAQVPCRDELTRLAETGRAAGIVVLCVAQRASVDRLPARLGANLSTRLVFRCATRANSMAALDWAGAERLRVGEFLMRTMHDPELIRGTASLSSREELVAAVNEARAQWPHNLLPSSFVVAAPVAGRVPSGYGTDPAQRRITVAVVSAAGRICLAATARALRLCWRILDTLLAGSEWALVRLAHHFRKKTRLMDSNRTTQKHTRRSERQR